MTTKVILDPKTPRKDAEKKAYRLDLDTLKIIQASEDAPFEIIYRSGDGKTTAHLIDDHLLDTRYFLIEGTNAAKLAAKIRKELDSVDEKQIPALVASTKAAEVKQGISAVALLAPAKFNKRFFSYFEKGFAHKSADVREHTVLATGYVGWPQLAEPLQELAENDSNTGVRESATLMLNGFGKKARGELKD
jgi:hypothetical protein